MISVARFRQLLHKDCDLSDEEIQTLRDLNLLSREIVKQYLQERRNTAGENSTESISHKPSVGNFQAALQLVPEEERTILEERAAVMEFDGELSRDMAERSAIESMLSERRK
jgi:hypothetical protein